MQPDSKDVSKSNIKRFKLDQSNPLPKMSQAQLDRLDAIRLEANRILRDHMVSSVDGDYNHTSR